MNIKQALAIIKPKTNDDAGLKAAYREASKIHHPDFGGDVEIMKLVNLAYEFLRDLDSWWTQAQARDAAKDVPLTETIAALWGKIKRLPDLSGELIGSWLWVSGDTYKYRKELKEYGFKFSRKKSAWYYHEGGFRKRSKKSFSMNDIRGMWGNSDLESETGQFVAA